jgi:hypothetical protein
MATPGSPPPLPWATQPSGRGAATCDWCGRSIYAPATPCSLANPAELMAVVALASAGAGDRCEYEARTRGLLRARLPDAAAEGETAS